MTTERMEHVFAPLSQGLFGGSRQLFPWPTSHQPSPSIAPLHAPIVEAKKTESCEQPKQALPIQINHEQPTSAPLNTVSRSPIKIEAFREDTRKYLQSIAKTDVAPGIKIYKDFISSPDGIKIPMEVFQPINQKSLLPGLIFIPGSSFVVNLDVHQGYCSKLAAACGIVIVAIQAPLAPEHSHQTAFNAVYYAAQYIYQNASKYSIDHTQLGIGGHSSGGNYATLVAQKAHKDPHLKIQYQVLVSPRTDASFTTAKDPNFQEAQKQDPHIKQETSQSFVPLYCKDLDPKDARISPLYADLSNQPEALVVTGTEDALLADACHYAVKLPKSHLLVLNGSHNSLFTSQSQPGKIAQAMRQRFFANQTTLGNQTIAAHTSLSALARL